MYKILKIEFSKKTSSKSLSEALRLAGKLKASTEGDIVTIDLTVHEVFNLWEYLNALLNIIDKWRSFEIRLKGVVCTVGKEYRRLFYALQEIRQCYNSNLDNPIDYEKCNDQWGCNKITSVSLRLKGSEREWYKHGALTDPKTWTIDKNKILNMVQVEIENKHLTVCPAFPINRIKKIIDNIDITLPIGAEWFVEWTNELVDGILTPIPTIHYNEEFEEYSNYVDKETANIAIVTRNPYDIGSDEWFDWRKDKGL